MNEINKPNELENQIACRHSTAKECDILRAATELFSERGYAGTTTQAIAKKANVSEKTLFKYFPTKQELYENALNPAIDCFVEEKPESFIDRSQNIRELLHDLFVDRLSLSNKDPNVLKLTMHEFIMNPEFRSTLADKWTKTYLPVLLPQIELSEHSRTKYGDLLESSLTRAMIGLLAGYAFDKSYIRTDKHFDDEKEIEFMLDLLFNGINGLKTEMGKSYYEK